MNIRWSKTALVELDDLFSYISERNRTAAKSVVRRIEELVAQLGQFPYRGHVTDEPDAWGISVVRHPYIVLYAIDPAADERHAARDQLPAED